MSTELFSALPYKVADITLAETVKRCPYHGIIAHDHPDRCTD